MKIFLTGSSGLVGSNLLQSLKDRGDNVFAPSRHELNLLDFDKVVSYLHKANPDIVIHAAGKVGGIQANIADPAGFLYANTIIGFNVIEASRSCGIPKLLNLGSSCMYPKDNLSLLTEDDILSGLLEPTNEGYAIAKIGCMKLCEYLTRQSSSLQYKTVIPCNLYGEHDSFEEGKSHLIPAAIKKVYEAKINGSDVVIWGDGTARREFMYIKDLISALLFVIDRYQEIPVKMNIGLGYDYSVKQYYEYVAETIGFSGDFKFDLEKPSGMNRKLMDSSILQGLGWIPSYSIHQGLRLTYNYYLKNLIS